MTLDTIASISGIAICFYEPFMTDSQKSRTDITIESAKAQRFAYKIIKISYPLFTFTDGQTYALFVYRNIQTKHLLDHLY